MTISKVSFQTHGHIGIITFNNPPLNMLTEEMLNDYINYLDQAAEDERTRAVIITSSVSGRFSAGLNLNALHEEKKTGADLVDKLYIKIANSQFNLNKPSIAAINGTARGGGMTLAIGCDVIICSDNATFGYPEIASGILPSIHFYHLPKIVGKHRAFELLFSGRSFNSQEAKDLGLITAIHPEEQLLDQAIKLANSFSNHSPDVIRVGRKAFKLASDPSYLANVQAAADNFASISATSYAKEGISSFIEKREPSWRKG